jgi:predicted PurR-regulated permease PerM
VPRSQKIERASFLFLLVLFLSAGLYVLSPFFKTIFLGIILVTLFFPVHQRILKWTRGRKTLTSLLSVLSVLLFFFIPLVILLSLIAAQVEGLANQTPTEILSSWYVSLQIWVTKIEDFLGVQFHLLDLFHGGLRRLGELFARYSPGVIMETANFLFQFFILLIVLFFLFRDGKDFFELTIRLLPVKDQYERKLAQEIQSTIYGVFYGSFVTALIQSVTATLGYFFAGLEGYLIWGVATFFASFIPFLGTGAVIAPLVLFLLSQGKTSHAIFLSIYGVAIIGLVDNLVKPLMIRSNVHPLLVFLSLFGGVVVFGPLGILMGPILLSLLTATIKLYAQDFADVKMESQ